MAVAVFGCRERPVPIPAPGIQLTSLTHVEDVASMLALVPGNRKAIGQMYNVCSDRCISFVGTHPCRPPRLPVPCQWHP